jgi:hypothetical protein
MTSFLKVMITYSLVGVLLSFSSPVSATAPVKLKQEAKEALKRPDHKSIRIKRATEFIKKIEGEVLFTENNKYSLRGVKILDLRKDKTIPAATASQKNMAEMTFFDGRLLKVVIHQ